MIEIPNNKQCSYEIEEKVNIVEKENKRILEDYYGLDW
jgi:hypothetical protein